MSLATYEEVLDLPNHPEKLLIDVRGADELAATGQIPTSINIPLEQVAEAFSPETNSEKFQRMHGAQKPASIITLSCPVGREDAVRWHSIPLPPLGTQIPTLEGALNLPADEFKTKYGRDKPQPDQEVIFHCKLGGRAQTAADLATRLGYTNARNYKGSWTDWAAKQGK